MSEAPSALTPSEATARVLAEGLIAAGLDRLPWSKALTQWRGRVMFLRAAEGEPWPDLSDAALAERREDWLVPALFDKIALKDLSAGDLSDALMGLLPWELRARLEREAPTHFEAPTGSALPIDYEAEQGPTIAVRLQELFGLTTHPSVAGGKVPLVLELLSPAHRPVQVTRDLPGFWRGSYAGGARRSARPLSAASLARRSGQRAADPARQAARHLSPAVNASLTLFAKIAGSHAARFARGRGDGAWSNRRGRSCGDCVGEWRHA